MENNRVILSLDLASRKTGFAIYDNDKIIKSGTWGLKCKERYADLYRNLVATIEKYKINKIVAEDIYKDDSKKDAYERLAECRGVAECVSQLCKLEISFITPISIKQHIYGLRYKERLTRKEQKQRMINKITRLGYKLQHSKADDEADAIGLLITYLDNHKIPIKHPKQ